MKNWKTTLIGLIAGATQVTSVLTGANIHAGHFGGTDIFGLISGVGVAILGAYAKDHDVTGGSRPVE